MTVAELQEAKARGCPVILKNNPPKHYGDIKYRRVLDIVTRRIDGINQSVAVLEDYCGRSVTYAELRFITKE